MDAACTGAHDLCLVGEFVRVVKMIFFATYTHQEEASYYFSLGRGFRKFGSGLALGAPSPTFSPLCDHIAVRHISHLREQALERVGLPREVLGRDLRLVLLGLTSEQL